MFHTSLRLVPSVLLASLCVSAVSAQAPPAAVTPPATPEVAKPTEANFEYALMKTSKGEILLELDAARAPISVANFVEYAKKGYYDGTIFHRVIATFMIQGGGFDATLTQKETSAPIKNEWKNGLKNARGTIAMARTNAPDSATSQFFINTVENEMLDVARGGAAYAVFGRVVEGMSTVDSIKAVPTGTSKATTPQGTMPMTDVPVEAVVIEKVTILSKADAVKRMQAAPKSTAPTMPAVVPAK